ncbi:two-component system nitrogen regulation sensor histidine kinase NtrY [Sphingomonas jejuensis]|uniref:histidine kinase n=1 Tax=Sphingomonas jejuensis TaxID=904715 RepID=A0ABX0XKX3_9SPHN|nr:ATP-binding protein [Sphingomonas jejuensis]NJC33489.1 two-component system nitrogen regulation sensor histidine kinase NtrY [Sphingomonas jejuensis]
MDVVDDRRKRGPRWQRLLSAVRRRGRFMPLVELATVLLVVVIGVATWGILSGVRTTGPLTPALIALLLVSNLLPAIMLLMLIGRRIARRRALASAIGGGGRLHVRLVAIFSLLASVPMLLVVVFASLLFQYGVEFWFSDRARSMLENAREVGQEYYERTRADVARQTVAATGDIALYLTEFPINSPQFLASYEVQIFGRDLSESALIRLDPSGRGQLLAAINPENRDLERRITREILAELASGPDVALSESDDRVEAVSRLVPEENLYLYVARVYDRQVVTRSEAVLADYNSLLSRSRTLQLRFNAALYLVSLLIVGMAVLIALKVADRVVRPVGELVAAARRVAAGDLTARVERPRSRDEVGILSTAFNRMTRQLESQTGALVSANDQLDARRALTEAVLSGVSAGVVSVDQGGIVRLLNSSAEHFLGDPGVDPIGRSIVDLAPELGDLVASGAREAVVQLARGGEVRTLAVRLVKDERATVLTFDDITQQLLDQRRAAWADVARRIAHEIKNPLTPIQLAAERLQRRYGKEIASDPATFSRLTETIVRQVGDLRRMVDEFSSFARMPKPVFRPENLGDIARQTLFLHEVAHPGIRFSLDAPETGPVLVCDRRQIAQALTNLVKNAVEAVEARPGEGEGAVSITIDDPAPGAVKLDVADTGIGLPADRERIAEPYVTGRAKGTGLGLAIVKKIAEEHHGTLSFSDRPGGGAVATLTFDAAGLGRLADSSGSGVHPDEQPLEIAKAG